MRSRFATFRSLMAIFALAVILSVVSEDRATTSAAETSSATNTFSIDVLELATDVQLDLRLRAATGLRQQNATEVNWKFGTR